MNPLERYARWLHTGFPSGGVEPLPEAEGDGATSVTGLRVAGDLLGTPLLKLAVASGSRAVRAFARELGSGERGSDARDVAIVGAGPAGLSAALECRALGLSCVVLEARAALATIHDFPAGKPIYLYPTGYAPESPLTLAGDTKETLLASLEHQVRDAGLEVRPGRLASLERVDDGFVLRDGDGGELARARRVLLAIGRSGDRRKLSVPGEELPHVRHRLHDPADHEGRRVVVVGGGDSAVEAAVAIADAGGRPVLVHRARELARPKRENREALGARVADGRIERRLGQHVTAITDASVAVDGDAGPASIPADDVLVLVGRQAPHALLRRLGVRLTGERTWRDVLGTAVFLAIAAFVYTWKSGGELTGYFRAHGLFPFGLGASIVGDASSPFARVLAVTLDEPGFHYSVAYSLAVLGFGLRRVARTPTPYVRRQTLVLALVQWIPLFVVPYFLLPWLGRAGFFDHGALRAFADAFFPAVDYGHGREYWRAFGFVLAFPLFIWNVFTAKPSAAWLALSFVQTFVVIPLLVRRWGKGAYCGWICSCGALAETMGDAHRTKMPHGPAWNRLNLLGQAVLFAGVGLFALRVATWISPRLRLLGVPARRVFDTLLYDASVLGVRVDYYHVVDVTLAGILGVGLYFAFSGRVWCRFACPLAALMHVYARAFGRFRIFADASRCIACNQCTSVCHQGIDVMHYALRGAPMDDPECVRCSACVSACPTATLSFGRERADAPPVLDVLEASPVRLREDGKRGLRVVR